MFSISSTYQVIKIIAITTSKTKSKEYKAQHPNSDIKFYIINLLYKPRAVEEVEADVVTAGAACSSPPSSTPRTIR